MRQIFCFLIAAAGIASAAEPDFEELKIRIEPFEMGAFAQAEVLTIEASGRCSYKVEPRVERPNIPGRRGAFFRHQLPDSRIERFNELLGATAWLTAEGADGRATHTHPDTIKITLERGGESRTVVCHGQRPEPYAALLLEIYGLAMQERRVYLHDHIGGEDGDRAWFEIGSELSNLRRDPESKPGVPIDFSRFLFIAARNVRDHYGEDDDELLTSIRLIGWLRAESEVPFLHRMAHDRASNIRSEVAWALGRIGAPESLPVLLGMMEGTKQEAGRQLLNWGDAATEGIIELISKSTDSDAENRVRNRGEWMIRAYLDNWDEVEKPIDERVVEAVRESLEAKDPANGMIRTTYHEQFLKKVAEQPRED